MEWDRTALVNSSHALYMQMRFKKKSNFYPFILLGQKNVPISSKMDPIPAKKNAIPTNS